MRAHAALLGDRILQEYPALHQFDHPVSTRITGLLRTPFPAQTIAIMGVAKRWQHARTSMVVAECGTGKTLIALETIHVHSQGSPFTALAMVPPHLVEKWAREAFLTLPGIRVFLIDDLRNGGDENKSHGVNEVRLRQVRIVREGFAHNVERVAAAQGFAEFPETLAVALRETIPLVGRERAKLGYSRIEASPQITLMAWTRIEALEGDTHLKRVLLHNTKTGTSETRDIQHVFMMTGADPNTEWLLGSLVLDAKGFIKTGVEVQEGWPLHRAPYVLETSLPGIFAVGDIRAESVKRVASAVGEGSMVVQFVHKVLAIHASISPTV